MSLANPPLHRNHDPLVCGLEFALSCPACQGEYYRDGATRLDGPEAIELAVERWHSLRLAHRSVIGEAGGCGYALHPEPLDAEQLATFVWTLLLPRHRALFRELAHDLLIAEFSELAEAIDYLRSQNGGSRNGR